MADRVDAGPAESTEAAAQAAASAPSVDSASTSARVRSRLARIGRGSSANPVLDPLLRIFREGHPKGDAEAIVRAYGVAEQMHEGQLRKSGEPDNKHPLAVATNLAELGMPAQVLIAA
jgi:GTP pyrophosphokinase